MNGTYSTPVWSPRGDYIAFTKQGGGQFSIGIMKPDGSGERILTSGFHNEGPTFAPNGRVLMFFRDPGGNERTVAVHRGHFRTQRTAGSDPRLRVRSGVVAAAVVSLAPIFPVRDSSRRPTSKKAAAAPVPRAVVAGSTARQLA